MLFACPFFDIGIYKRCYIKYINELFALTVIFIFCDKKYKSLPNHFQFFSILTNNRWNWNIISC
jgi:hypothetical protein